MDTQTNNKLIADFIGLESNDQGYLNDPNSMHYIAGFSWDYGRLPLEQLRFDVDWNWLMYVIKRISNIRRDYEFGSEEEEKFEDIFHIDFVFSEFMNNDLENMYIRVIEFIKWYNTQNQ